MSILPESGLISFARGVPSPDFLPVEALAECAARAIRRDGRVGHGAGERIVGPLRVPNSMNAVSRCSHREGAVRYRLALSRCPALLKLLRGRPRA